MWCILCVVALLCAASSADWPCPRIPQCACDLPHTLRCSGEQTVNSLRIIPYITNKLRRLPSNQTVSLLDISIQNINTITDYSFHNVTLQGLVVSTGNLSRISNKAFSGLEHSLVALGLPDNALTKVPSECLEGLTRLERLDLSGNRITSLSSLSLRGLNALLLLDLSNNGLTELGPDTFLYQSNLQSLILDGNFLDVSDLTDKSFNGLVNLKQLSLQRNYLQGSVSNTSLPSLVTLQTLLLNHNNFTSIRRGALKGLKSLRELQLSANHIDVIEDHAFYHLSRLHKLDVSRNGIVTVSGYSLDNLHNLRSLDMSHNYLRAITADLLSPLSGLQILNVEDNDISIIQPGVFTNSTRIKRLILTDNPFHCDCRILDFVTWLNKNPGLTTADKTSALCATPPQLENGVLVNIPEDELTCGGDDISDLPLFDQASDDVKAGLPKEKVELTSLTYDGSNLQFLWHIDRSIPRYECDALYIYQQTEGKEVLRDSIPLSCSSFHQTDPAFLDLVITDTQLVDGNNYRFCLTLTEGRYTDIGCSNLTQVYSLLATQPARPTITAFYSNITSADTVSAYMRLTPTLTECQLTLVVFVEDKALSSKKLNCSAVSYTFKKLSASRDMYRVCATFDMVEPASLLNLIPQVISGENSAKFNLTFDQCIDAVKSKYSVFNQPRLLNILVAIMFALCSAILMIAIYVVARKLCIQKHPKGLKYLRYCSSRTRSSLQDINYDDTAAKDDFSNI